MLQLNLIQTIHAFAVDPPDFDDFVFLAVSGHHFIVDFDKRSNFFIVENLVLMVDLNI